LSVAGAAHAFDKDGELVREQDRENLSLVLDELKVALAARVPIMA
jgi:hypothetical protein